MTKVTFLGTCGGRFATIYQKRATGGLHVTDRNLLMSIDPGPGALVQMHRFGLDPSKIDAVLVSHAHPDHYTDAEILVQAMTRGGLDRRGTLVCSKSCIEEQGGYGPVFNRHHLSMPRIVHVMEPDDEALINDWYSVKATRSQHTDPSTIGFQLVLSEGVVSYIPDTAPFEGLAEQHRGSDVVIIEAVRPHGDPIPHHLSVDQAAEVIKGIKPKLALLHQFGMKMLAINPATEASWVTDQTGIPTLASVDGMELYLGEEIQIGQALPTEANPIAPAAEREETH